MLRQHLHARHARRIVSKHVRLVVDTLTPVAAVPGAFTYTGHDTITAGSTVLTGNDYGAMYFVGPTTAKFVTTVKIVGGGSGWIVAPGTLDTATGQTAGTYFGVVCT